MFPATVYDPGRARLVGLRHRARRDAPDGASLRVPPQRRHPGPRAGGLPPPPIRPATIRTTSPWPDTRPRSTERQLR